MRKVAGVELTIVGGSFTDDELAAARAVGHINIFQLGPGVSIYDILNRYRERLPEGFALAIGGVTHSYDPDPPAHIADKDPILMGFCRVHHGDPHYPYWLYRAE